MSTYIAIYGEGFRDDSGEIVETDTSDVCYFDSRGCMTRHVQANGAPGAAPAAVEMIGNGQTVSYGAAPGSSSPGHEWCPTCGTLVMHGDGEDSEHFDCDGGSDCSAPASIAPEYVTVDRA